MARLKSQSAHWGLMKSIIVPNLRDTIHLSTSQVLRPRSCIWVHWYPSLLENFRLSSRWQTKPEIQEMVLKERNVVVPIPKGVKNIGLFLSHYCYFRECETGPPMTRSSRRTYPEFIQKSLIRSESFFSPRCGCRFFIYISCNCNDLVQIYRI